MLFAWRAHADYPLVFAGNRDEAYQRPSAPAAFWDDEPRILGGRDIEKGGSWLALSRAGRFATVTNYRTGPPYRDAPRSRGELVANFLRTGVEPRAYLEQVRAEGAQYRAFSLIVGDMGQLFFCSNHSDRIEEITPGIHGLSNHLLDTPWPKVRLGQDRVRALLGRTEDDLVAGLFDILTDRTVAPDADLPDTGVGLQRERELSPCFIANGRYGTRASTVLLIGAQSEVLMIERAFGPRGAPLGSVQHRFKLDAGATEGSSATRSRS